MASALRSGGLCEVDQLSSLISDFWEFSLKGFYGVSEATGV